MVGIIVAHDLNRVIGCKGKMPWYLPNELNHFKEITEEATIIMGRKTMDAIGRPLPKRENIVVTRNKNYKMDGVIVAYSIEEALKIAKFYPWIIGGQTLYEQTLEFAERLEITVIDSQFEGDTFFPLFDESLFEKIEEEKIEEAYSYQYISYRRK